MSGLERLIHQITTGDILSEVGSNFSRTLTAWLSIGSTYTYLTVKRLRTKINDLNLKINFHPFSVRTVMKDMDNIPFPPSKKPKVDHMWRDIQRRSILYNFEVPKVPVPYPINNLDLANCVALVGVNEGWILEYLEQAYKLWFIDHIEAGSVGNLNESFNKINLDAETIIETANSSKILHQYEQNTQTAKDKSVFGSPTFIVGSELFWGDDRLEDAIEWARK